MHEWFQDGSRWRSTYLTILPMSIPLGQYRADPLNHSKSNRHDSAFRAPGPGDCTPLREISTAIMAHFAHLWCADGPDQCILRSGRENPKRGYGHFISKRAARAHRAPHRSIGIVRSQMTPILCSCELCIDHRNRLKIILHSSGPVAACYTLWCPPRRTSKRACGNEGIKICLN